MPSEPLVKRAVAFIDGQNLYHAARESFVYTFLNFDIKALSLSICRSKGWELNQVHFYTQKNRRRPNVSVTAFVSVKLEYNL
jgi:hypothetical protein